MEYESAQQARYGPSTSTPPKNPRVFSSLEQARSAMVSLGQTIEMLYQRLHPVMSPRPASISGDANAKTPGQKGIAEQIDDLGGTANTMEHRLHAILDQLDL